MPSSYTQFVGYCGIGTNRGIYVNKEDAVSYALQHCHIQLIPGEEPNSEFTSMLEEWFFSGDWIEGNESDVKGIQ